MRIKRNSMIRVPLGRALVTPRSRWAGYLVVFALVGGVFQSAEAVQRWERTYGRSDVYDQEGYDIRQLTDGSYAVCAEYDVGTWLIRLDSLGDTLWTRYYKPGGRCFGAVAQSLVLPDTSGLVMVGFLSDTHPDFAFAYVLRVSNSGDSVWASKFSPDKQDAFGRDIAALPGGGFAVIAWHWTETGSMRALVYKIDNLGHALWFRDLGYGGITFGEAVEGFPDGGMIVTGRCGAGPQGSAFLTRLDSMGGVAWQYTYGGYDMDGAWDVHVLGDGSILVGGTTYSWGAGLADLWLFKTDSGGHLLWQRTFGGPDGDWLNRMWPTADGGCILAGQTLSFGAGDGDVYLVKADSAGTEQWSRTFGGQRADMALSVQQTSDGGYVVAGEAASFSITGDNDVYVVKTDALGSTGVNEEPKTKGGLSKTPASLSEPTMMRSCELNSILGKLSRGCRLTMFDALGRNVLVMESGKRSVSQAALQPSKELRPGVYYVTLQAGPQSSRRKLILLH